MTIFLTVSLIYLARSARFDIVLDSIMHTFPVHHRSHHLFEARVPMVVEVMMVPSDSRAGMISLSFLNNTCVSSMILKLTSLFDVVKSFL